MYYIVKTLFLELRIDYYRYYTIHIIIFCDYIYAGLFKMIHSISNYYIFEVYKYIAISDTSTKRKSQVQVFVSHPL